MNPIDIAPQFATMRIYPQRETTSLKSIEQELLDLDTRIAKATTDALAIGRHLQSEHRETSSIVSILGMRITPGQSITDDFLQNVCQNIQTEKELLQFKKVVDTFIREFLRINMGQDVASIEQLHALKRFAEGNPSPENLQLCHSRIHIIVHNFIEKNFSNQNALSYMIRYDSPPLVSWLLDHDDRFNLVDGRGELPLLQACQLPTLAIAELLVQKYPEAINTVVPNQHTALTWAIRKNNEPLVHWLLDHGARVNLVDGQGGLPLEEVLLSHNLTIGELLVQKCPEIINTVIPNQRTALTLAITLSIPRSQETQVRWLLDHGARVDLADGRGKLPLVQALQLSTLTIAELLVQKCPEAINTVVSDQDTALTFAIFYINEPQVRWLLDHGARVDLANGRGELPLVQALRSFILDVAELLIQKCPEAINTVVPGGPTALTFAITRNDEPRVRWLLDHGARVDLADGNNRLPLSFATQVSPTIMQLLLAQEASVNQLNADQSTLLTQAMYMRKDNSVRKLLTRGANPQLQDGAGIYPIELAHMFNNHELMHELERHGASTAVLYTYTNLSAQMKWEELSTQAKTDALQLVRIKRDLLEKSTELTTNPTLPKDDFGITFLRSLVIKNRLLRCLKALAPDKLPQNLISFSERIQTLQATIQEILQTFDIAAKKYMNDLTGDPAYFLSIFYSFSQAHYRSGLEGLASPPPIPRNAKPLQMYVDELWETTVFDPIDTLRQVSREHGVPFIPMTQQEARHELKRSLDIFISNVRGRVRILGAKKNDPVYKTIECFLVNIFEALQKKRNPNLTFKVLRDLIDAEGYCLARYLEASQVNYLPICLEIEGNPRTAMLSLCADMRDRCAQEVVRERYQGNVHALNMAKKEAGEELGLPGYLSVMQDDLFPAEATARGYTLKDFLDAFQRKYTKQSLVLEYLTNRLSFEQDVLNMYFRLYEELFPLSADLVPIKTAFCSIQTLAFEQKTEAMTKLMHDFDIEPINETELDGFGRYFRALALFQQSIRKLDEDLIEKYALPQKADVPPEEVIHSAMESKLPLKQEWISGRNHLEHDLRNKLHTMKPMSDLMHMYSEMKEISRFQEVDKKRACQALFQKYPDMLLLKHQTSEEAIQEAVFNEKQDALTHLLLEDTQDGSRRPKAIPIIMVLKQIGVLGP